MTGLLPLMWEQSTAKRATGQEHCAELQRPHQVLLDCEELKKQRRGDVALDEVGPKGRHLSVEVASFLFWHKTHAQHVLTGCSNIHGE